MAEDINQSITDLQAAIVAATKGMKACCQVAGGVTDPPPQTTADVEIGFGLRFETQEEYFDAKCNAANAVFDTILGLSVWLDGNSVDLLAGVFGGVTTGLIAAALSAGPVGWGVVLGSGLVAALATTVIKYSLNFDDISDALSEQHEECVKALFNASIASGARAAFVAAMADSPTYPTTALEQTFVRFLVNNNLTNQLYSPREDVAQYASPDPIDCGGEELVIWTFDSTDEGFSFSDESEAGSASGVWSAGAGGWTISLITQTTPAEPRARGRITKTGLSIAVTPANSVQVDFSAVDDNLNINKEITVTYSDVSTQYVNISSKPAGTLILNCNGSKTVSKVELDISRSYGVRATTPSCVILEARVQ